MHKSDNNNLVPEKVLSENIFINNIILLEIYLSVIDKQLNWISLILSYEYEIARGMQSHNDYI